MPKPMAAARIAVRRLAPDRAVLVRQLAYVAARVSSTAPLLSTD
jgi:hypothetical protein